MQRLCCLFFLIMSLSYLQNKEEYIAANIAILSEVQWNLSKLATDRSWNSDQYKQVVNLHKYVPK
jgi:hypothetical protein